MYNKILAPLDGSELSECSLKHVKAIASGCHVPEVVLLRVIEPVRVELYGEGSLELLRKAEKDAKAEVEGYVGKVAILKFILKRYFDRQGYEEAWRRHYNPGACHATLISEAVKS